MRSVGYFSVVCLFLFALLGSAPVQEGKPEKDLKRLVVSMENTEDKNGLDEVIRELITYTNSHDDWHSGYYLARAYIKRGELAEVSEKRDEYFDKGLATIRQTAEQDSENSEIQALWAYLYQKKLMVDPERRRMKYSLLTGKHLKKSKSLDADNPRPYFLRANHLFHTPENFGGGQENGCEELAKALELYENDKPAHPTDPSWGKNRAEELWKKKCLN